MPITVFLAGGAAAAGGGVGAGAGLGAGLLTGGSVDGSMPSASRSGGAICTVRKLSGSGSSCPTTTPAGAGCTGGGGCAARIELAFDAAARSASSCLTSSGISAEICVRSAASARGGVPATAGLGAVGGGAAARAR